MDKSGSMSGAKLKFAQRGVRNRSGFFVLIQLVIWHLVLRLFSSFSVSSSFPRGLLIQLVFRIQRVLLAQQLLGLRRPQLLQCSHRRRCSSLGRTSNKAKRCSATCTCIGWAVPIRKRNRTMSTEISSSGTGSSEGAQLVVCTSRS